ncbi:MAG: response regulator transcription factor [Lachnospiraceae bacterium]|nr:response regulator transcription factor [Lachnospiraceae bacterium]
MKTILVIDDDVNIGNMLEEILTREGFAVRRAYSGTEAKLVLSGARPDLILLDLMLPGLNGEELLPEIKNIPVIVISAKAGIDDKVSLLAGGAVDYVTKPFDTRELLARINVQMRKSGTAFGESLKYGDIVLEADIHSVSVCQKPVRLTPTEYAILKLLMRNPSQVIAKSVMLERISESTPDCVESSLKVHVSNLRRKLREAGGVDYIESVWGIGFKLKGE